MPSMHAPRSANPVDTHVGERMKQRRQDLKMSQEKLGDQLGVTFQQVQKYERGANRVSASRLWKLSQLLEVPVSFFFEGLSGPVLKDSFGEDEQPKIAYPVAYNFINTPEGRELAEMFSKIQSPELRQQILELARVLAAHDAPPSKNNPA